MTDQRPANCRKRLIEEGKPVPGSGCRGCGQMMVLDDTLCPKEDQRPAPPTPSELAARPVPLDPQPGPLHGSAPQNTGEFEVNSQPPGRRLTRTQEATLQIARGKAARGELLVAQQLGESMEPAPIAAVGAAAEFIYQELRIGAGQAHSPCEQLRAELGGLRYLDNFMEALVALGRLSRKAERDQLIKGGKIA